MNERKQIVTTEELSDWYNKKYNQMKDGWFTPAEECHRHLDDLGVPFDKTRRLLDVGAGAGHFLLEAQKRVDARGVEISDAGIQYAYARGVQKGSIDLVSIEALLPLQSVQYDYIVSIGSLEHIVDLDTALDNIRELLTPDGKFYFYCPNERWAYFDQPNERTMTDEEWKELFEQHGLETLWSRRWGGNQDNTAFCGVRVGRHDKKEFVIPPRCSINAGSGQRPFDQKQGWVNIDIQDKYGPDIVGNWNDLSVFPDESVDMVVAHHVIEHVGCGEADPFFKESFRVLRKNGSLLVFVPDLRALAQKWLTRQIDDYTYIVNLCGAYMGDEADRHRWQYTPESLTKTYYDNGAWSKVKPFDYRAIPGASLARDFWILAYEGVK